MARAREILTAGRWDGTKRGEWLGSGGGVAGGGGGEEEKGQGLLLTGSHSLIAFFPAPARHDARALLLLSDGGWGRH